VQWLKDRGNALLDNLLWALALLVVAAVGASIWAWGGKEASLPVWLVVLFGAVQAACVIAIVVLFVRRRAPALDGTAVSIQPPPDPPHPHEEILDRIDAFRSELELADSYEPVPWRTAAEYNELLDDAQRTVGRNELHRFSKLHQTPDDRDYADTTMGPFRTSLGQLRMIVKHSR
jgi:hypothetical protein